MAARYPLLEMRNVCRRPAHGTVRLLDGVSLRLFAGERLAVTGASGSGKTLLLRALAMLDPIDEGNILWNGATISRHEVPRYRSRVIYLHQRPVLFEGTVDENLRQPLSLKVHRHTRFDSQRIVKLLELLGRGESFLIKRQRDLSGGEIQITALLRAIQLDPDVLLLDEPAAALDRTATDSVQKLVSQWLREKPAERACVWVSHDRELAIDTVTRVFQMVQGRLEAIDSP